MSSLASDTPSEARGWPKVHVVLSLRWACLGDVLAAHRFGFAQLAFAWTAIALFPAALWHSLAYLGLPADHALLVTGGVALAYMLGERDLASQRTDRPFAQQLVSGFGPGAWLLSALTLAWTAPAVADLARRVLDIRSPDDDLGVGPAPWIAAAGIGLVTLTSTLAARLHHRAGLLFPTPWLAVLALSLVFASYGACWLGRVPLPSEFVLLWAGWRRPALSPPRSWTGFRSATPIR